MSDERDNDDDQATSVRHDASFRVDPRGLSGDEQSFARLMGFGEDGQPPGAGAALDAPASPTSQVPDEPAPSPAVEASDTVITPDTGVRPDPITAPAATPAREWEEIHPRAASLGRQSMLVARADRVARLEPGDLLAATGNASAIAGATAPGEIEAAIAATESVWRDRLAASERRVDSLESTRGELAKALADRDEKIASLTAAGSLPANPISRETPATMNPARPELDKQLESARSEIDRLEQERDQLGDALSIAHAERLEALARAERLDSALRAACGPNGPIPEGDRDLRAEVIGLRRRLEESSGENRSLREALDATATDLAIARAHRDDRAQELEQHREQIASLERDREDKRARTDELLAKQRELLALMTRVQAENVELRSTQAALEETLEARDLEISAREEHLQVTRRGLATRDEQLIDAEERLEQARHRHELIETEMARLRLAHADLDAQLARREARVASLSLKLQRVEEAIGRSTTTPTAVLDTDLPAPAASVGASQADADSSALPEGAAASNENPASRGPDCEGPAPSENPADEERRSAPAASRSHPVPAVWRDAQIRLHCGESAETTVPGLFARHLRAVHSGGDEPLRILSLAGDRLEAEVALFAALTAAGESHVAIEVLEPLAERAALRRSCIEEAGQSQSILVRLPEESTGEVVHALFFDGALSGHAEASVGMDLAAGRLAAGGLVLFCDRLAGGPVALSEETRAKLAELWQVLPEGWTALTPFAAAPEPGDDGGAPVFDSGATLDFLARFTPRLRVGFGHVSDLFVGPARVAALMQDPAAAETLLASLDAIDESRSILESLTARHGLAVLVADDEASTAESIACETHGLPWP